MGHRLASAFALRVALAIGLGLGMMAPAGSRADAAQPATAATPTDADLRLAAALIHSWAGRPEPLEQARALLDALIARGDRAADAYRLYAELETAAAYISGDTYEPEGLKRAEAALDRSIALAPASAESYVQQADLYLKKKRPADAEAALARAESLGADGAGLTLRRALMKLDKGEYEQGLALCRPLLKPLGAEAEDCLMTAYLGLGRLDDADALYRKEIARDPQGAWSRGNYASFLLCRRHDAKGAIAQATAALARMDYGMGRSTLAAALYHDWADQVQAGRAADAERAWALATSFAPGDAASIVSAHCSAKVSRRVLYALRDTGRATLIAPMLAVLMAADNEEDGITGVFAFDVRGTGNANGEVYLNSEVDYRDQRTLTIRFTPAAAAAFHAQHAADPATAFKGKRVTVVGTARRQRIDFRGYGVPSGKYYFQTHVIVTDPAQVAVYTPVAPPRPLPVRTDA